MYNITNSSTSDESTNFNWGYANFTLGDDLVLEDSRICSVTGTTTGEGDADAITLSSTTVLVDRAKPSAPTTSHTAGTEFDDVNTKIITYAVTGENTTSCRIAFLGDGISPRFSGTNTFAMVHTANTCKYTLTKATIPDGSYNVYARASDGTNKSVSSKLDLSVKTIGGDNAGGALGGIGDVSFDIAEKIGRDQLTNAGIIIVLIILAYAYFNSTGNSKKN